MHCQTPGKLHPQPALLLQAQGIYQEEATAVTRLTLALKYSQHESVTVSWLKMHAEKLMN